MAKNQARLFGDRAFFPLRLGRNDWAPAPARITGWWCLAIVLLFGAVVAWLADADLSGKPANALPLYARQTGQPCAACHTAFPELTPFGRRFKLGGYTLGGGDSSLPFSVLLEPAFTHTDASQPTNAANNMRRGGLQRGGGGGGGGGTGNTASNNDVVLEQAAVFTGGRIADNLGAFVRATYDHASDHAAWDNADLRYANTGKLAGHDLILGVSFNNNPTVQDVWNTIGAWRFPYHVRRLERPQGGRAMTATSIEGGFSRRSLGLGGYAFLDDLIYAELSGYRSLSSGTQRALGLADNSHNILHSLHVSASYIFDNTWSFTADRFSFGGTSDARLYRPTGSPSNSGWTAEIAYLPFMHGGPSFWPWLNARIGLQYTFNDQNPHNNTLLLYSLILF